jgi:hypothetical protein
MPLRCRAGPFNRLLVLSHRALGETTPPVTCAASSARLRSSTAASIPAICSATLAARSTSAWRRRRRRRQWPQSLESDTDFIPTIAEILWRWRWLVQKSRCVALGTHLRRVLQLVHALIPSLEERQLMSRELNPPTCRRELSKKKIVDVKANP